MQAVIWAAIQWVILLGVINYFTSNGLLNCLVVAVYFAFAGPWRLAVWLKRRLVDWFMHHTRFIRELRVQFTSRRKVDRLFAEAEREMETLAAAGSRWSWFE